MSDYRKLVLDSLDKAYDNGYDLSSWPANEVVDDLMRYDDDLFQKRILTLHKYQYRTAIDAILSMT